MPSSLTQPTRSRGSTASTPSSTMEPVKIPVELEELPSIWSLLTPELRRQLLRDCPHAAGVVDSLEWMQWWTKTKDEQDPENPYKPLPRRPYFELMHELWQREPVIFFEKSRSMITSWYCAGETTHYVMTHQPAVGIFWAQDERRAVKLRDYAWVLWEQQDARLRALYPVIRP